MRHDKACPALHHRCKGILYLQFRARINRTGGLIQNKHRRQTQHHSRNTKQLFLTLRKISSIFSYLKNLKKDKPVPPVKPVESGKEDDPE